MAPVVLDPEVKYTGAAVVALHILSVVYFTQQVVGSLRHSYKSLSPSQDVRLRSQSRKKLIPWFSSLAIVAFAAALHSAWSYAALSYGVWADERGIGDTACVPDVHSAVGGTVPPALNSSVCSSPAATNTTIHSIVHRVRWLADTPIYQDAFEIVAEKARRFWWGQQIDIALVPWSVLLAVEGNRRGIPSLFAFQCLAHLVSFSFAQNLFYVALLLTPAPLPEVNPPLTRWSRFCNSMFSPKPRNWCLGPGLILTTVIASYGTIFLLPYAAETPSFNSIVGISRLLTFAPLVLHKIAPESWGVAHPRPPKTDAAFADLFRFMAFIGTALHVTATITGLRYNVPHAHYHRHSKLLPWDIEERSRWERTTTAVGKLLGATGDHPVVSAVGRDVLLSGLSLGIWAAVRSLDSEDMLVAVIPLYKRNNGTIEASDDPNPDNRYLQQDRENTTAGNPRRSRRQQGSRTTSISEASSHNREQESETPARRGRGRPRKAKPEPEEEPGDSVYEPSASEEASAQQGDPLPAQDVDLEASALAWGLIAVGGLGLGSVGVFGAELLAR